MRSWDDAKGEEPIPDSLGLQTTDTVGVSGVVEVESGERWPASRQVGAGDAEATREVSLGLSLG